MGEMELRGEPEIPRFEIVAAQIAPDQDDHREAAADGGAPHPEEPRPKPLGSRQRCRLSRHSPASLPVLLPPRAVLAPRVPPRAAAARTEEQTAELKSLKRDPHTVLRL